MASDLIFYTNPASRGQIVRWMLEEVGAPYETVIVDFGAQSASAEYRKLNPMAKVPTVIHKGKVITECAAICAYLAEAFLRQGWRPRMKSGPTITAGCSSPPARSKPRQPTARSA